MAITDSDEQHAIQLVCTDVQATAGHSYDSIVCEHARRLRGFLDDPQEYLSRVAEETQQELHDRFIDTSWPACPLHGRHPLWLHSGYWCCGQDHVRIAALGELPPSRHGQ